MEKSKQDTFLPTSNLVHHLAEIHQKWLASFPPLHVQMALSENVLPSPKSKTRCSLDPPFWGPKCHLLSEYIHKISVPYWHIASLEIPSSKHCHGCGTSSSCKWFSWRFPHGGFHIYVSFLIKCPFIPLIPIKIQKSHWNRIKIPSKSYWNPKKKTFEKPLWSSLARSQIAAFKAASVPSSSSMRRKVLCATKADSAARPSRWPDGAWWMSNGDRAWLGSRVCWNTTNLHENLHGNLHGKCVGENDENHEVSVRYNLFFMEINLWKCWSLWKYCEDHHENHGNCPKFFDPSTLSQIWKSSSGTITGTARL